jgi:thiol-disulfide isomerase/thioredoxin
VKNPRASWGLITAVVAAAAVGFTLSRHFAGRDAAPPSLPPPAPLPVPAVRPVFSLVDTAGTRRSITEWDGRALIVNFWATWCPPCRREIPLLNALQREHGARGFQVIGIAVDFRDAVLSYVKETPVAYPVLIGEQEGLDAAKAFGMATTGFPFTVFTDHSGNVITIFVGELHRPEVDVILATILEVNAGRLPAAEARGRIEDQLAAIRRGRGAPR